ncbi:pectin lyase-like protein [Moesziomyces antarcticus]|uniref:pectinesterase n=2 Tax=Pseudozyma antarctica TaxID=84753 RepID=A0A081CFV0_PSEA2|nr:pectin lyase-like protein [Moesziomyces antarcticus]GAK65546.1 pectin lyase-like protein [Moesziomyces antarcticus]
MLRPSFSAGVCLVLAMLAAVCEASPVFYSTKLGPRRTTHFAQCQAPKIGSGNPLAGCPSGTIFVSKTHPAAMFRTISAALSALPDNGNTGTVLIDQGQYHEKVVVTRVSPTVMLGVTPDISSADSNRVQVWQSSYVNQSDVTSVLHNCDATVLGVGNGGAIGNSNFKAYNIDFAQRQFFNGQEVTEYQLGPAAALCVQSSNASFYGCGFSSYQDTIYVGADSQAFFFKSIVKGMTDQLYGSGKAWFEKCKLLSRACGGGITAWRGDPTDPLVGVYISNSIIAQSPDASKAKPMVGRCHLGRPWNVYSHAVYLNTFMSDIVADAGFRIWSQATPNFAPKLTRFAEHGSSGPGGNARVRDTTLETILSDTAAAKITIHKVFGGSTPWIDLATIKNSSSG